ncbi:nuclear transport factor 2 family protein [Lacibacter sp.]|uniref:nuclear transport factor 2 family protein n=1 Tax=Lacibacter sp. TaxID=1915409 RepID=UPI002B4AB777|nr:nuclear transport factor 2 family protein [Lacibacter sp.]HLP37968.1 nuclear transport factor 2 family protein [Lacibacter sp.]
MKKIFLLFFVAISLCGKAQSTLEQEEKAILKKVELFFQSLEKQDTALYRNLFMPEAQGWSVRVRNDSIIYRNWFNADRVKNLINPSAIVKERKLSYEIKVHQQIAMAWVPYTLSVSGKFSHCGVDLFTFIKTDLGWKISSCSFTIEPNGCDALLRK